MAVRSLTWARGAGSLGFDLCLFCSCEGGGPLGGPAAAWSTGLVLSAGRARDQARPPSLSC